eukprot:SAG11_NODE_285_length_11230_cov_6.339412_6_plen_96_part_00
MPCKPCILVPGKHTAARHAHGARAPTPPRALPSVARSQHVPADDNGISVSIQAVLCSERDVHTPHLRTVPLKGALVLPHEFRVALSVLKTYGHRC